MVTFLRPLLFLVVVGLVAGCASSPGRFEELGHLNHEASQSPSGSWFTDHDAMRHMQCFPAYCSHR